MTNTKVAQHPGVVGQSFKLTCIYSPKVRSALRRNLVLAAALLVGAGLESGCHTPAETAALTGGILAGATLAGAAAPTHEIEQVYYLGVFDPNEQVPTSIYRLRVHGQSSVWNATRFASGWVPAKYIDSLSSQVSLDPNGTSAAKIDPASADQEATMQAGRKLCVFGPEGFRPISADYRLVIVMSADPSQYFSTIDQMLGISATPGGSGGGAGGSLQSSLLAAYQKILTAREQLGSVTAQP